MVSLSAADKTSQLKKDQILKCCHAPHTSAKGKKKKFKIVKKKKKKDCINVLNNHDTFIVFILFFFYNKRQMKHCNSVSQHKEAKNRRTKLELKVYELRVNIAPSITAPSRSREGDKRTAEVRLSVYLVSTPSFPTKQNRSIFFYYRQKYHCCWI